MKTSCITHPANERLVIIRKWQVDFCEGNQCSAAILSFFEYWHNWKLDSDNYNHKSNNIAEMHGEARFLSEDVYQYHSLNEMSDGILNLYGAKAIAEAIKVLESKGAISVHANPNPRFYYDKTKYFRFYPEVCNEWIHTSYKSRSGEKTISRGQKSISDDAKTPNASSEKASPSRKKASFRTEINYKEFNQSINDSADDFLTAQSNTQKLSQQFDDNTVDPIQPVLDALIEKGLPAARLQYPDVVETLQRLQQAGATTEIFVNAFDVAVRATQSRGFGINYLAKVVLDILDKSRQKTAEKLPRTQNHYHESDVDSDKDLYVQDLGHLELLMSEQDGKY
jgi:hypothetical protein